MDIGYVAMICLSRMRMMNKQKNSPRTDGQTEVPTLHRSAARMAELTATDTPGSKISQRRVYLTLCYNSFYEPSSSSLSATSLRNQHDTKIEGKFVESTVVFLGRNKRMPIIQEMMWALVLDTRISHLTSS